MRMTSIVSCAVLISIGNLLPIFLSWPVLYSNHAKFVWNAEVACHFAKLKTMLCSSPVLRLPDMTRPFEIETDAYQFAIGVVLK